MVNYGKVKVEEALQIFLINTFTMSGMMSRSLFRMVILKYAKHVREIFDMTKLLPPTSRKN